MNLPPSLEQWMAFNFPIGIQFGVGLAIVFGLGIGIPVALTSSARRWIKLIAYPAAIAPWLFIFFWSGYVPTIRPGEVWLDVIEGYGPWHPGKTNSVSVLEVKEGFIRVDGYHGDMPARTFCHIFKKDYTGGFTNRLIDTGLETLGQVTNSPGREP